MTFKIGVQNPKFESNVGILFRSAYQLGAEEVFTIGKKYRRHPSDTYNTCRQISYKSYQNINEIFNQDRHFSFVAVEQGGEDLSNFIHPDNCIYILGSESAGLSNEIKFICDKIVTIPSARENNYNVAVAGSIIMYDRLAKYRKKPPFSLLGETLTFKKYPPLSVDLSEEARDKFNAMQDDALHTKKKRK